MIGSPSGSWSLDPRKIPANRLESKKSTRTADRQLTISFLISLNNRYQIARCWRPKNARRGAEADNNEHEAYLEKTSNRTQILARLRKREIGG
jgi:hypothetical protein